jgi:hypothetical protein
MINKKPYIETDYGTQICWQGWRVIGEELNRKIQSLNKRKTIIAIECYHGTYENALLQVLKEEISPNATCVTNNLFKDEAEIRKLIERYIQDQQLFGKYFNQGIEDFFDESKLRGITSNIKFIEEGVILILGIGTQAITKADILVYADIAQWEVQQRFRRNDIANIGVNNYEDSFLKKQKWAVYIDWRICNQIKKQLLGECDYFLETNNWAQPKLATGEAIREALKKASQQPFFQAPFFDPELWDTPNQNSKEVVKDEFLWYFNCSPTENNLLIKLNDTLFEVPVLNLVLLQPLNLLGKKTYKRFGAELPIYVNFIDTLEGENTNISIQPDTDFIRTQFDVHYFPDKMYYVMSTQSKAKVHLNWLNDLNIEELLNSPQRDYSKLLKSLKAYKVNPHDFVIIPAGVVHSSGVNTMILQISSTTDIYSLKLWDTYGEFYPNLPKKLQETLLSNDEEPQVFHQTVEANSADNHTVEILGDDIGAWLEVRRYTFSQTLKQKTEGSINVLNLLEGEEVIIISPQNTFKPFVTHYAETVVIPACVEEYEIQISPKFAHKPVKLMKILIN